MGNVYICSDTHFNHVNFIRGTSRWDDTSACRPFATVEEHDEVLIQNINAVCRPQDTLYHLGDFAWERGNGAGASAACIRRYRDRLRVRHIVLIAGNHDNINELHKSGSFTAVIDGFLDIYIAGGTMKKHHFVLCHYPMRAWNRSHAGSYHLFGHVHGKLDDAPHGLSMDVGLDTHPLFQPYSLGEIHDMFAAREFTPVPKRVYKQGAVS